MARIRIRTTNKPGTIARGQDLSIVAILDDGTEEPLRGVVSLSVRAKARDEVVHATLTMHDAEIDIQAETD